MRSSSPNIIWITLESVRADHTTVNGYERDTTPNLQRIATQREGASFSRCFAQSMWTPASSASILTGTYPFFHQVGMDGKAEQPLPADLVTFPQLLSEYGYRTACLSPNAYLGPATNLDKGFDKYLWISKKHLHKNRQTILPLLKYLLRLRSYGHGLTLDGRKHNKTYVMMHVVKQWLRSFSRSNDPFFCYIHCPNPHHPYTPPRKWIDRYTDEITLSAREAFELSLETFRSQDNMKRAIVNGCDFTSDEWDGLQAMYDAEITYADEFVGRVFDYVQRKDFNDTIFIITADHGDLFGEHGLLGHNLVLDDGLTHVPLVTYGLADLQQASDDLVQHIDLTQTLAEYIGCADDQFQGTNLLYDSPEYCISQRGKAQFDTYLEHDPDFDTSRYYESPVTALRTTEFKYLKSANRSKLFRLPDEETDVSQEFPEIKERLDRELDRILEEISAPEKISESTHYTEEMKRQLSDLGYL